MDTDPLIQQEIKDFYLRMYQLKRQYQYASLYLAADRIKRKHKGHQVEQKVIQKNSVTHRIVTLMRRVVEFLTSASLLLVFDKEMRSSSERKTPVIIDITPISIDEERGYENG